MSKIIEIAKSVWPTLHGDEFSQFVAAVTEMEAENARLKRELAECQVGWKTGTRALEENKELHLKLQAAEATIIDLLDTIERLTAERDSLKAAQEDFRDTVLHQRHSLSDNGMTGEQINDVLAEFDTNFSEKKL